MLTAIHPKLPMRNKKITKDFYLNNLGFGLLDTPDFDGYLMLKKDNIQIHFFEFKDLLIHENYGQVYIRTNNVDELYRDIKEAGRQIHPHGNIQMKPWGQKEFAVLDPDNNLLTFGQEWH